MNLKEWLEELAGRFEAAELSFGHGTDNAWDEAVALTLGTLDWSDDAKLLNTSLSAAQLEQLNVLAERRVVEQIPVPLLVGFAYFAGLKFLTAPGVMIPRSPIAELVRGSFAPWLSAASDTSDTSDGGDAIRVLDVCCGGGCIGISIAHQFAGAQVVLSDIDGAALELARQNVELHELSDRVDVVQSDLFEAVKGQHFDLIVSNPPYVPTAETQARPAEFQHEPSRAYDGGASGLSLVRQLLRGASQLLTDEGLLVIEVGQWSAAVEQEWPNAPFIWPELEQGGEGVLVLEARVVAEHTARWGW